MSAVAELAPQVGVATACCALGVPRASFYRARDRALQPEGTPPRPAPRGRSHRRLSEAQEQEALALMHSDRFVDVAPAEIVATLLDEEKYVCSARTLYRLLARAGELRERRNQLVHPQYKKPELIARGPNEVWSWDITKLRGPAKWSYFYLYVVVDIFSRYVVGWMVAERETAALAAALVDEICARQSVDRGTLTLHMDRGAPMRAKTFAQTLADLGVTRSYSRPHTSNDNPFSEALFKTTKYNPTYPGNFDNIAEARDYCGPFFEWYNDEHRHSGIAMLTPAQLHYGEADEVLAARQAVLDAAWAAHPERFVRGRPRVAPRPAAVWINPPTKPTGEERGE